jgi:hypothetical protein
MTLTSAEREAGYKQPPMPAPWAQIILRRIAGGRPTAAHRQTGRQPFMGDPARMRRKQ